MKLQRRDSEKRKYSYCLDRKENLSLLEPMNSIHRFLFILQNDWFHKKLAAKIWAKNHVKTDRIL